MAIAEYNIQVPTTHGLKRHLRESLKNVSADPQISSLKNSVDELLNRIKQASESEDVKQVSEIGKKLDRITEQNSAIIAALTDIASLIKNIKQPAQIPRLQTGNLPITYQRSR